jgi:hypothetical protein
VLIKITEECLYSGLLGGRTKTALTLEDVLAVTTFLTNFSKQHALVLPGRIPGFARDDISVLPSHYTKKEIWSLYYGIEDLTVKRVKYSAFRQLWRQLLPYIVLSKPMTDLCWVCQRNNGLILK